MTISVIRSKLYDYIRVADDKKVEAIFKLLEDDIIHETDWWKNENIVKDFQDRILKYESGEEKSYSLKDIKEDISKR